MVTFDYGSAKTLLYGLAPFAISWLIRQYRNLRASGQRQPTRAVPPHVQRALNILFAAAIVATLCTLPRFRPENIFKLTSSAPRTPSDILWERVAARRPDQRLTPQDERLQSRLTTVDGRCLYFTYGPEVLADCPICNTDNPKSFFLYALPSLLLPHLLNLAVLGLATSASIAKREGSRWRAPAALLGSALALLDAAVLYNVDWRLNARAPRARDLWAVHWLLREARFLGLAAADALCAAFLWATATNRLLAPAVRAAARVESAVRDLEVAAGKMAAAGIVQNAAAREPGLRMHGDAYWRQEEEVMGEVMAEKEVVDAVRAALGSGRIDINRVEAEAEGYAESLLHARMKTQ